MLNLISSMVLSALLLFSSAVAENKEGEAVVYENSKLLSDIFIKRYSATNFQLRPLSEEQISALMQSARLAPSSYNDQPWNFIFCDHFSQPEAYLKARDAIYGQDWVETAPLLVIAVVRSDFTYNKKKNDWAEYDTGAAALSMSLQATDIGLVAHQIGGFDSEQICADFKLPEGFHPIAIIAIGYEDQDAPVEKSPRLRRPLGENFFNGEWGKAFE